MEFTKDELLELLNIMVSLYFIANTTKDADLLNKLHGDNPAHGINFKVIKTIEILTNPNNFKYMKH